MKLLIIEDDIDLNRSLVKLLKTQQYSVDAAYDGQEALDYLRISSYDVIISDIMMPNLDGLGVLHYLRNHQIKTPVLMLTAKDSLEDKVVGLDAGADDYLVKPFEFEELLARIRVLLRRENREHLTNTVTFGDYCLDFARKTIRQKGNLVDLTSKEFELLEYLVRHPNIVLTREQIREHIWDFDYEGESNIIDVLVKNIRKKLQDPTVIQTKRGVGYVFAYDKTV
ncbi:response regulator transcription factor [Streptococcus hyovaginalis]|uniref:response regulator transcription factor n=1 Tax=Streptococcus hyovaginalis TaxID=149015 RepID=UPI002A76938B|nr:response regulator transcription factor [Streptococcus hyovaginalis]MDY3023955.1 response regulator transcription factor [Streptococcus hyovaginalis]MDY4511034.1 response regulator transcription factor [Streptococcus hyovaginalis]